MSQVSLSGLRKEYSGGVLAVNDVSLEIEEGEFVTLVGPSGCGKTTTLRMIAGLEEPSNGRIVIGDEDVTNYPPYRRNAGMVFQQFALFPHLTVGENIAYGLEVEGGYTKDEIADRVEEMLKLVQLPETADRKPEKLSGGQQQRIALARALAPEPEILLLDEPLASLDKKLREEMQKELREIQEQVDITTIFVTHNQTEAMTMSDRLVVMNDGEFEQVGEPATVYDRPHTRFVADFLGISNIFDGTLGKDGDSTIVECGDLRLTVSSGNQSEGRVSVVVRPENVSIDTEKSVSSDTENAIYGTVNFRRNLGSAMHYHITTKNEREVIAISQRNKHSINVGENVTAKIDPADCLLISG
jgi:spermidine/putrescine ABC transporter ATP-binding subunit